MACINKTDLENAKLDQLTLEAVINGPASGTGSTVTTRFGVVINTLAKIIASGTTGVSFAAVVAALGFSPREKLSAPRTYYVRSDGNDANTGLANNAGGAKLNIQGAINAALSIDASIYDVTIQIGDKTYTERPTINGPLLGSGTLILNGNSANATAVILNGDFAIDAANGARVLLQNLETRGTVHGVHTSNGATVTLGANCRIGTCGNFQLFAENGAITVAANYVIAGGGVRFAVSSDGGRVFIANVQELIAVPISYAAEFLNASYLSRILYYNITHVNIVYVTATKYNISTNSMLFTNGAGAGSIPGATAGSLTSGGIIA